MSKRLVLVLLALFVFAVAVPAFAAVQNVKVSGDIIGRYIGRDNFDLSKEDDVAGTNQDEISVLNSVVRLRVDADLTDNVSTVIRLINERNWDEANAATTDIDLDLAYVTLKEFLYSPLTLAIGRQELHFGNDMIIGDGVGNPVRAVVSGGIGTNQTTNYTEASGYGSVNGDLAYRKAFDAIRATLNYDPLVVDLVYAKIKENLVTGGEVNDDTDLYGINAGYKFKDKWSSLVEGYIWHKVVDSGSTGTAKAKADTVLTVGARVSTNPTAKLNLQQEIAWQGGSKAISATVSRDRNAWASQSMALFTPGWKHNPTLGLIYSYFSGDASISGTDGNKDYHAWDPMFENQSGGHIINALFPQYNAHNIDLMATLKPSFLEDVTVRLDYVYQLLAKRLSAAASLADSDYGTKSYQADKKTLGTELDASLTYDYTEDVQFGLLLGWFKPSKALTKADREPASEAIASCAVRF